MRQFGIGLTVIITCFLLCAGPAQADQFIKPTYADLLKTLVRFNALDLNNDKIIDEFAMATECKIYVNYYHDDFAWQKFRQTLREGLLAQPATLPDSYYYDAQLQLGRYDFKNRIYRFIDKSAPRNVNAFVIYEASEVECGNSKVNLLPKTFRLVLPTPLDLEGILLSEEDAKKLLQRMQQDKNEDRLLYARFNMRVTAIAPFRFPSEQSSSNASELVQDFGSPLKSRLNAQLVSINFYEDQPRTKLVYSYRP